jgi:hypothetical protein
VFQFVRDCLRGRSDEQTAVITSASVIEYDVTGARPLT